MMKPTQHTGHGIDVPAELKRIMASGALASFLLLLAILMDEPVSILAWALLAVAFLCLAYVLLAARRLLIHTRAQELKDDTHD